MIRSGSTIQKINKTASNFAAKIPSGQLVIEDAKLFDLDNLIENSKATDHNNRHRQINSLFKYQGIYCFGGKKETDEVTNELKVLDISTPYPMWHMVATTGKPPHPRFGHTMMLWSPVSLSGR